MINTEADTAASAAALNAEQDRIKRLCSNGQRWTEIVDKLKRRGWDQSQIDALADDLPQKKFIADHHSEWKARRQKIEDYRNRLNISLTIIRDHFESAALGVEEFGDSQQLFRSLSWAKSQVKSKFDSALSAIDISLPIGKKQIEPQAAFQKLLIEAMLRTQGSPCSEIVASITELVFELPEGSIDKATIDQMAHRSRAGERQAYVRRPTAEG